jgi:hypothetical protein
MREPSKERAPRPRRREEKAPGLASQTLSRRRLTPPDIPLLQRTAGNQATVRMLQRTLVPRAAYFKGIAATSGGDPEWDPKWTKALDVVAGTGELSHALGDQLDDADENTARKVIGALTAMKTLSSAKPNPFIAAIDAIRFHFGIESDSGGSGFGSLDTSATEFEGRPAFPKFTQETVPVKGGQHRRHILAWHDLREFMQIAYGAQPEVVIGAIREATFQRGSEHAFSEAFDHVGKGRKVNHNTSNEPTHEEWLKVGLFVMNGNPRNLWPGRGSTNSALNTAQMAMTEKLNALTTFQGLHALATDWQQDKGKAVYNTSTKVAGDLLMQLGGQAHEQWVITAKGDQAQQAGYVKSVATAVSQLVVSNLQIDVLGDSIDQNLMIQFKQEALREPRTLIDHVVQKPELIKNIEPPLLSAAIREFLAYA